MRYSSTNLGILNRLVRDGRLTGTVVFWHAGGLPGLFERLD